MQIARLMVSVGGDISDALNSLNQLDKAVQDTGAKSGAMAGLTSAIGGIATVAVAAAAAVAALAVALGAAAGAAALGAWKQLDDAADTLTLKVGATGAALDGMVTSVQNVYTSSAGLGSSMGEIAARMGEVEQVTKATGSDLENLTAQLSRVAQADKEGAVGAGEFGRMLEGWQVPASQGSALLDEMYAAQQKFGVSTSQQAQVVTQFGGSLREMGLSLDQSLGLFAQTNAAGINTEKMMSGLSVAAGKFAKDGVDMASGLEKAIAQIKAVENPTKAAQIAVETFGAKAGPQLADAIRSGAVGLGGLQKALGDTEGSLKKATEATMDFPEKLALIGRQAQMALAPAGKAIADSLGKALDEAKPLIDSLISGVAGMATKLGPVIEQIASGVIAGLGPIQEAVAILSPGFETLANDVAGLVNTIAQAIAPGANFGQVWQEAVMLATAALQTFLALLDQIVNGAAAQAGPVMDVARAALSGIGDAISFMLPGLQALLGGLMDLGSNIGGLVVTALSQISGWLSSVDWEPFRKAAMATWDTLVLVFSDMVREAGLFVSSMNIALTQGPQAGWNAFMAGNTQIAADHTQKMTQIEANLQMSMVNQQSIWATGMAGSGQAVAGGLNNILGMYSDALNKVRAMQLGMQLGKAGGEGYNYSMGAMGEPPSSSSVASTYAPAVASLNKMAGGFGDIGKAASGAGKAAGEAKKSAEEMAKQAAETLKTIVDATEKLKEFLDKGYSSLVGDGALAGKITALSEALFATGRIFVDQLATAMAGLSEKSAKAADLGGQAIGHAASALKSMVELLPKMWDFSKSDAWGAVQSSPALFTQMSATLIDMGRAFFDQMAAASTGIEENSVKAAQLLATGIQASSQAISSVISAVKGMWEMYASGLWDEVQANRALLLQMSAWLIDMGREMFEQFAAAAQGVDENAVKAAGLLAQGIQSATGAIGATLKLVQDLLAASFDPSFLDALFGETRGQIMAIALALIDFGKSVFEAFAAAAAGVKERTVAAAKLLADGVKAAADGLKAAADSLRLLMDVASHGDEVTAIGLWGGDNPVHQWMLAIARFLARFARDITEEWGAAGLSLGSRVVAAAKRLADGVKAASDGLKSAVDSLRLLSDVATHGDEVVGIGLWGGDNPMHAWLLAISRFLAQMALDLTEEWGHMGNELGSVAVAGARRLADGIKAASEGIASTIAAMRGLAENLQAVYRAQAALPGDRMAGASSYFAHMAHLLTGEWGHMGNELGSVAVAGAQALASGIDAVAKGSASLVSVLTTFLESQQTVWRAQATFNLDALTQINSWFAHVSHLLTNEWGRLGNALETGAASGAKALADGIGAVSAGATAFVSVLTTFLESQQTMWRAQATFNLDTLTQINSWFANVALVLTNEWGRVGGALETGAAASAKSLADGVGAVASGAASLVSVLTTFLNNQKLVWQTQATFNVDQLTMLTSWFANVALIITNEWGRVGGALNTGAAAGAKALADGIGAVSSGLTALVTVLNAFLDNQKLVYRTQQTFPSVEALTAITSWFANVALLIANEWGRVGGALATGAVDGSKALSDGISAAASGVQSTVDALTVFVDSAKLLAKLPEGDALIRWVTGLSQWFANVALIMVNQWGPVGATLEQATVDAVKRLSDGAGAVASALSSTMDTLVKLADWLKKPVTLTDQMLVAVDTLATDAAALWVAMANALTRLAPPTDTQTEAVKAWTDVADFTSQAIGMMDTLVKLSDWLKKPATLTDAMTGAAATLAVEWTQLWVAIATALAAIMPPTEDQDANVKAWAGVADFTGQALGMMDTLVKLSDWLKKPVDLTLEMRQAAGVLAVEWTQLWWSIWSALKAITPPTETQQANVKAWSQVADFTSQAVSMIDTLVKLSDWLKKPVTLTLDMRQAAGELAVEWTQLWWSIWSAIKAITPPTETQQANVKAWAGVADFSSQAVGAMDTLVKLSDWLKKPVTLTDDMLSASATLTAEYTRLWWAIQQALIAITPPTEDEQANVKAWSGVADFTSQALSMMDSIVKLSDWLKKPSELTGEMREAVTTLAVNWTQLWWTIQQALELMVPPTEAEAANVKAWSGIADFTNQALSMIDTLAKLSDFVKKPAELTADMKDAAVTLAVNWTQLWWTIQQALELIPPPTEAEEANVKAWAGVSDFASQALGMIDTLKKLDDFLKKPSELTAEMKTAAAALAVEFTELWWTIQGALEGITPPTDLEQAGVKAWSAVADAFGIIDKTLSTIKSLMEFSFTTKVGDTSVTQTGIPAVATIQQRVKDALAVGVMMLQAIVTAAQDPTLANDLTTAAQEASAALAKVAGDAFTVIGGVLSTVKSLFEFGVTSAPGFVQLQGGNNIWSTGSFSAGIPDATAVTAKVTALMAALKAIVDEVKNGVANIALGEDPAALQAKLGQVLAIVSTAAALVKAAQDMAAGGTGKFALSISIAVAFAIPDLAAEIAKINVPVIHIPVVWDVPPLATGNSGSASVSGAPGNSGSGYVSGAPGNSGSGSVTSITVNQYVSPQIAADPAGTIIQLKGLYA